MEIAIIGGGAAGFFAAINIKRDLRQARVTIYERASRALVKVGVSGGGRCNLTNTFDQIKSLHQAYPRGDKLLKRAFKVFDYNDTYAWFEDNGIALTVQDDECIFPTSQDSQEIIDKFLYLCRFLDIDIATNHKATNIESMGDSFRVGFDGRDSINADIVIVTAGGQPQKDGFNMLSSLPIDIVEPVPSLFSLNVDNRSLKDMMGIVVEDVTVSLQSTKIKATGDLLITHWGVSGPATLKLSSYGARYLKERDYKVKIQINWIGITNDLEVLATITDLIDSNSKKMLTSLRPYGLTQRLWTHIITKADISLERRCGELGSKGIKRLVNTLKSDEYQVTGKGSFKDEFVTCGGVSLDNINPDTMECRDCKDLYFAGEVLDIDAITGGFNLQAAWTTGYTASQAIIKKHERVTH